MAAISGQLREYVRVPTAYQQPTTILVLGYNSFFFKTRLDICRALICVRATSRECLVIVPINLKNGLDLEKIRPKLNSHRILPHIYSGVLWLVTWMNIFKNL